MNILSLFDGISVARYALDLAGIPVKNYYSVEIEKNAISISKNNYPSLVRFGSVVDFSGSMLNEPIDILIGGSPCQDLSIAKKNRKGLEGERSGLFWEYIRLKNDVKPKWFILENVASMSKIDKDIISEAMGCEPILFNASLVSAQTRKRLFWTNIPFTLPVNKGIILSDILQPPAEVDDRMINKEKKAYTLTASYSGATEKNSVERHQRTMVKVGHIGKTDAQANRVYSPAGKSCTLSANGGGLGAKTGLYQIGGESPYIRKLTPVECERLQSLPDNYTEGIAQTNRYKCLGNAFNAEVVAHIMRGLLLDPQKPQGPP